MTTGAGHGPIEEIGDVLTGQAAGAAMGMDPVPEAAMMNEAQGPADRDHSPVTTPVDAEPARPSIIDVDDDWGLDGDSEGGDKDFVPGDPITNDLTDADPDARPAREVPDPATRPGA